MHNIRIWNSRAPETNCYVDFAKDFTLKDTNLPLTLKISADTEYVVWLNGQFVARGQYHTFPHLPVYDTVELSSFAQAGVNRLAITVYYQGEQSYQYAKGEAGLWFTLHQNDQPIVQSDGSVYSSPSLTYQAEAHRVTPQYGFGFVYDANQQDDWQNAKTPIPARFTASDQRAMPAPRPRPIEKCEIRPAHYGRLVKHGRFVRADYSTNPALAVQTDTLFPTETPISTPSDTNPYYIWDLGREMAGFITLTVDVPAGAVVDLAYGEHLGEHGVTAHVGGRNFANRYVAKEGKQTFTHYFRRIAGRYLQLHVLGQVNTLPKVGLMEECYPLSLPALPQTGNETMNRILHTARNTLRQCMHELYEDCPWREQSMYAGDSSHQILAGYYAFHETKFPRASLDLMGQSMRDNGFLAITAPTDEFLQIPSFTFMWMSAMANYLLFTKDTSLIEQYYPAIAKTLSRCVAQMPDNIAIHPFGKGIWNFYEWSQGSDGGNIFDPEPHLDYKAGHKDGLYQMFLYIGLNSAAQMAEALRLPHEQTRWKNIMSTIKQGVCDTFWNEEKQRFASFVDNGKQNHYAQLMQSLALFNRIDPTKDAILCDALMHDDTLIPITLGHAVFRYESLLRQGDEYKDFVYQDVIKVWGKMLDADATTFWETELGAADFGGAGSLCHGWSAVPLYLYCRYFEKIAPEDLVL